MKHTGQGAQMTKSFHPALGECLRAAEADANRFHGVQAPPAWQGRTQHRGAVLLVGFTLLAVAAAVWLGLAAETEPAAAVTVARVSPPAAASRPPALVETAAPVETVDEGDIDTAASMPASVLTPTEASDTPRVAPMNVPTVPDEHDRSTGEPEA